MRGVMHRDAPGVQTCRPRCAILTPSEGIWGGGQIYAESLCNWMCAHGWDAYMLTSEPGRYACPAVGVASMRGKWARLQAAFGIGRKLAGKVDVVVLNDLSALWLAPILRLFGLRVVGLLHLFLQKRSENRLGHGRIAYEVIKQSAHLCRALLSVNEENVALFGSQRCRFVANYVPDWFFPTEPASARKEWDFLLVARLAPQKDIPLLLQLLANQNDRGRRFSALIVGEGPEHGAIQERIGRLGLGDQVRVRPWTDRKDLPRVYDAARVFVISSVHEGFATTLLESHARGVPAIVTRSAGYCSKFVEGHGGPTGLSFEPRDVDDESFLARAAELVERSADYANLCTRKARLFSEEVVLDNIASILSEVCDPRALSTLTSS